MPELTHDVIATDDGLGIFLPEIDTLVIADLHLGIELALFGEGTYIPVDQFQIMQNNIVNLIKKFKPRSLVINGDFKHEFGRASPQEWYELKSLYQTLSELGVELEIVRGNHDNYLKTILSRMGKTIQEPYYITSDYLFMHGHQGIDDTINKILPDVTWIILAHEHPAIVLRDDAGGKHKFRCFLKGKWKKCNILVLPAYSPFTSGAIVNEVEKDEILSPILKEIGLKDFKPIVVDSGEILSFPTLKQIREVNGLYLK